jgi:hypothetical protein
MYTGGIRDCLKSRLALQLIGVLVGVTQTFTSKGSEPSVTLLVLSQDSCHIKYILIMMLGKNGSFENSIFEIKEGKWKIIRILLAINIQYVYQVNDHTSGK